MNRLEKRNRSQENLLLERRYIRQVLEDEGKDIKLDQSRQMSRAGFRSSELFSKRRISVTDTVLGYQHLARHRFIDMKRRKTVSGPVRKKNHPIHNRIFFGHANNIVRRISFGFTEEVKRQMSEIE